MQSLAQTSSKGTAYSAAAVASMLSGINLSQRWKFDRIQMNGAISDLTPYVDTATVPEITYDTSAAVRRTIKLQLRGDAPLLALSDLLRVHHQILAPDGGWLDWPVGTFTIIPPQRNITPGYTQRMVDGLDLAQLLVDSGFTSSYGVPAGALYVPSAIAIAQLYGGQYPLQMSIIDSGKALPQSLGWQVGATRLSAVNQLMANSGNTPLWVDALGVFRSGPLPDYTRMLPSFVFDQTQHQGIAVSPFGDQPDVTQMSNIIIVEGMDERRNPFSYTWVNDSPIAEASTIRWHPKTMVIQGSDVTDPSVAQAMAQSEGQRAARVYSVLQVDTFPWAVSEDMDMYRLVYQSADEGLQINDYVEVKWVHRCAVGAPTSHYLERVVSTG